MLSFTLNANLWQTFLTKLSRNSFLLQLLRTLPTINAFMRFVTIYLADPRTHLYLPGIPNKDLAVSFNNYFIKKIAKICSDLIEKCLHLPPYIETQVPLGTQDLSNFQPITLPELQKLIHSTSNKNCVLDPIPTALLKQILPSIVALISEIINTSLRDGIVPESFKRALVKPLLEKTWFRAPGKEL